MEPPPAHHQSASATTADRKNKRRPPPPFSSGGSREEKQEHGHKVRSKQEFIDVLDGARKRVEETTKEVEDWLEQRKEREQTFLKRP